jgi:hypothetical protein
MNLTYPLKRILFTLTLSSIMLSFSSLNGEDDKRSSAFHKVTLQLGGPSSTEIETTDPNHNLTTSDSQPSPPNSRLPNRRNSFNSDEETETTQDTPVRQQLQQPEEKNVFDRIRDCLLALGDAFSPLVQILGIRL